LNRKITLFIEIVVIIFHFETKLPILANRYKEVVFSQSAQTGDLFAVV